MNAMSTSNPESNSTFQDCFGWFFIAFFAEIQQTLLLWFLCPSPPFGVK